MSSVADNIADVKARIAAAACEAGRGHEKIVLLAAVKSQPVDRIQEAIAAGIDAIGENRVQEMLSGQRGDPCVPLHFIGHLQRNKVRDVVGRAALIHSVGSLRLAEAISECAVRRQMIQDVLLQVNIAEEATKDGFSPEALRDCWEALTCREGLRIVGLMCIPPPPSPENGNTYFFSRMKKLFVDIRSNIVDNNNRTCVTRDDFRVLSMGMSEDYEEAVRQGSTMVRLGRVLFGERRNSKSN